MILHYDVLEVLVISLSYLTCSFGAAFLSAEPRWSHIAWNIVYVAVNLYALPATNVFGLRAITPCPSELVRKLVRKLKSH